MAVAAHARTPAFVRSFNLMKTLVGVVLAALLAVALLPSHARAQAYVTATPTAFDVDIPGGLAAFHNQGNANRLAAIYNAMRKAMSTCNRSAYDAARKDFDNVQNALYQNVIDLKNNYDVQRQNLMENNASFTDAWYWIRSGFNGLMGAANDAYEMYKQASDDYLAWADSEKLLPHFQPCTTASPGAYLPSPPMSGQPLGVTATVGDVPLFRPTNITELVPWIDIQVGPSFSSTGPVSNSDLGDGAHAGFGSGYQVGVGIGVPVLPGITLGGQVLYTGGLSPSFTSGDGSEKATGSAHAETFLLDTKVSPFLIGEPLTIDEPGVQPSAPPPGPIGLGPIQPYIDLGAGASVATMGQLTGHSDGIPTGTGSGETKTDFSWKAGAGVQFNTGVPGLAVDLGYDYLHIGNFSSTDTFNLFSGPSITRPAFNANVSENVVKFDLTYKFGPPSPPPP